MDHYEGYYIFCVLIMGFSYTIPVWFTTFDLGGSSLKFQAFYILSA